MSTPQQLILMARHDLITKTRATSVIKVPMRVAKVHGYKQIVYGEVYAPNVIDTHGDMMLPDDVVTLCHRFLLDNRLQAVDIMHNNAAIDAAVVESFIARKGDLDFTEGSWVAATKINDKAVWAEILLGNYAGYSMEVYIVKEEAEVEVLTYPSSFGYVEQNAGHDHVFYVEVDELGTVTRGRTSVNDGHFHLIAAGTATEQPSDKDYADHKHRFFLG